MPSYTFACPDCPATCTRFKSEKQKDDDPPLCVSHKIKVPMIRVPDVAVSSLNARFKELYPPAEIATLINKQRS